MLKLSPSIHVKVKNLLTKKLFRQKNTSKNLVKVSSNYNEMVQNFESKIKNN